MVGLTVTEDAARLHVPGSLAAVGVMAQVRFTVPLKPFAPVNMTRDVLFKVAPAVKVMEVGVGVMEKVPAAAVLTVTFTTAVCVIIEAPVPEVPVTVTV